VARKYGEEVRGFRTTQWSLIARAKEADPEIRRAALDQLLRCYYPTLRAHLVLHKRIALDRAEDLLQGFVSDRVLERDLVARADPAKGKFRSFLLRSLENYVIDQVRRERVRRTIGRQELGADSDQFPSAEPTASQVYDVAWARQVIGEAVRRMERLCRQSGRDHIWGVFRARVLLPTLTNSVPTPYGQLVERFGLSSPEQASNALMTAKRQFQRIVRSVVGCYTDSEEDVDDEIASLRRILASAGPLELPLATNDLQSVTPETSTQVEETDSRLLSTLLEIGEGPDTLWNADDLGALLRHELSRPLDEVLPGWNGPHAEQSAEHGSSPELRLETLADLLRHPRPPVEALRALKRLARDRAKDEASTIPTDVSSVFYFASIAAALVGCDQRITKSSDEVLRQGFQLMLQRAWLEETTRALFRNGLERLGTAR